MALDNLNPFNHTMNNPKLMTMLNGAFLQSKPTVVGLKIVYIAVGRLPTSILDMDSFSSKY